MNAKDNLVVLKSKLESLEQDLTTKLGDVEERIQHYDKLDSQIQEIITNNNKRIRLNIGGKVFTTYLSCLTTIKDNLFYSLLRHYIEKGQEIPDEIFIDRDYTYFPLILSFLRLEKIILKDLKKLEKEEILEEIKFYGVEGNKSKANAKLLIPESMWVDEKRIVLKGWHGLTVSCRNGAVTANQSLVTESEKWSVEVDEEDYISLKSNDGLYLDGSVTSSVKGLFSGEGPTDYQKFKVTKSERTETGKGDGWGIETKDDSQWILLHCKGNNYLVSTQPDGRLECNRTDPGPWERFCGPVTPNH